jgi:hypothetical protein
MNRSSLSALLCALLIAGCAGSGSRYACPGYPSRPLCVAPSDVYRLSEDAGPPPSSEFRPSLLETERGLAAGSGWVRSRREWN